MSANNEGKKREWVKNAAIIFLVIMLLLTFFSNTIMNYSLPEVSAQYVSSGTLSEQIRGTATVMSAQTYDMKLNETRTIATVEVKKDDVVEKGQVIMTLEDGESKELSDAQSKLDEMQLAYDKAMLETGVDYSLDNLSISNLEEDIEKAKEELANISTYEKEYEKAKKAKKAAKDKVDELTKQQAEITAWQAALGGTDFTSLPDEYYQKIIKAQDDVTAAEKNKKKADDKVEEIKKEMGDAVSSETILAKKLEIDKKQNEILNLTNIFNQAVVSNTVKPEMLTDITNAEADLKYLQQEYNTLLSKVSASNTNKGTLNSAVAFQTKMTDAQTTATEKLNKLKLAMSKELKLKLDDVNDKLDDANDVLTEATDAETEAKDKASVSYETALEKIEEQERSLEEKKITLAQKQKDDINKAGISSLDLEAQQDAIEKAKKDIERLKEKSGSSEIVAQVGGIISNISYVAGETIEAGSTVATIEMTEKGYTAQISATIEQSKKVRVGDTAEIQYFWYGDANATLTAIKPDSSNPAAKKILEFSITGDVTPGQSLQLVMGSKGQQYDIIVPNSAIREDNNGKFVLIVTSKSTPLGNRYIATRADITVLASDDTQSAVSGTLMQSDFVISTSTKPVKAGDQVRLVDSQ